MGGLRKFFAVAGLCLLLNGCAEEKKPVSPIRQYQNPPIQQPQKQTPVQPEKKEVAYSSETSKLVGEVVKLSEELHLDKGIVKLGRNPKGHSMYLSIDVRKKAEALDLAAYSGSNPSLEKELEELLSKGKYSSALTLLDGSGFMKTEFYDSQLNGFVPDSTDFIMLESEEGKRVIISPELKDPEYNEGYKDALSLAKNYLQSLLSEQAGKQ